MRYITKKTDKNEYLPLVDLSKKPYAPVADTEYLYSYAVVDNESGYLGHPDSVLLRNGNILTLYPEGHGKGKILSKISTDGGKTYTETLKNPPKSWESSLETPTIYRLQFKNGDEKLIVISGNPQWRGVYTPGGFNCSISSDEGENWTEFQRFFDRESDFTVFPIVAMASLTRLKADGEFADVWMGLFHDKNYVNYKTLLTFNEKGEMCWSKPEPYLKKYRRIERFAGICEVEAVRSEGGEGDEICLIARSNKKRCESLVITSQDEGKTWSYPTPVPAGLNGERHKAEYLPDGRLFITFRSIELDKQHRFIKNISWKSLGWTAWVGPYSALKGESTGDFRIKIAHTYLPEQTEPEPFANADTGYCGNCVLPDGTVVTCSYGIFSPEEKEEGVYVTDKGRQKRKTFIASKRIKIEDIEKLL